MFNKVDKEILQILRSKYPNGTRIRCIEMTDDPCPVPSGTEGTVRLVDDLGTIHVNWDNGRTLGLCFDEDRYEIV